MVFYDFEVVKYDWLVVLIEPDKQKETVIINDYNKIKLFYENHKKDIWVGFNSRHYDQYILKALIAGFSAQEMNDHIIKYGGSGWDYSPLIKKVFLINYDVMPLNSSLKQLEGMQGHNIHESSIPFDINRPLTDKEIQEMVNYCRNDVLETINVFKETINDFNAQLDLVKMFDLPLSAMSKTKAQISAEVLECVRTDFNDEWDLYTLDCLKLNKPRWLTVKRKKSKDEEVNPEKDKLIGRVFMRPDEWFLDARYQDYRFYFECDVAGVKHVFGWGGLHGALEKYHYECKDGYMLLHIDVASYYPSLMIYWNLLTRAAKAPKKYRFIYDHRLRLKRAKKKKEQAPLKIVLNGTYGICKDKNNPAYDPRNANLICVNGQLLLLDLIEHLMSIPSFSLVQSNTDGLIIKIHERDFDLCDDICYEWEKRSKMTLEFDYIERIAQKDVNNYVFVFENGEIERKGAYVKTLSKMDYDLPIINKALNDRIVKGVPIQKTINDCDDLIMFQKICKLTSKFDKVQHNGTTYRNKCYRVFASMDDRDGSVCKYKGSRAFKFANTSVNSFIINDDITGRKCPRKLNKFWYIDLAEKRLKQFGL